MKLLIMQFPPAFFDPNITLSTPSSAYVIPLMWKTRIHTQINMAKLQFCIIQSKVF